MTVMNGKRPAEDAISILKRTRMKLASPSPEVTSESDTESVHSCQGYKTEQANDTSDTSSSSSSSPSSSSSSSSIVEPYQAEYEVVEPEKEKFKFYLSDDSFEQDDIQVEVLRVSSSDSIDNGLLGDTSEENSTSPTSNSDVDPELPRNDYLDFEKCLLCETNEKDISYPYCSTCFTWKKNLFPDRPKGRKRGSKRKVLKPDKKDDGTSDSQSNKIDSMDVNTKGSQSQVLFDDSGVGSTDAAQSEDTVDGPSQASTSTSSSTSAVKKAHETCSVCFLRPEDGLFVHLTTAHRYGCYYCAKKILHQNGGCPLCRRKVYKVTRLYL